MTILWTEKTAAQATGGKAQGRWQASRVEIDSRKIKPGDLFVAIKGERFDGHAFIADAFTRGAVAAVVSTKSAGNTLLVEDTQKALEDLARFARGRTQAKVIGVTGSVGKTSTKEMLRLALSAHGRVHATTGNYNNHIGTPLNLANLPPDADFAVFEMGMNHVGEIAHLTRMVRPHIAVITNIEAVHLEFFPSLEAIADAKAEIFEGMRGTAILNADSEFFPRLKFVALRQGASAIVGCGEKSGADCRLLRYQPTATGCSVKADICGKQLHFPLAAVGRHWAKMAVMTLAVTHALNLPDEKTAKALATFSELEGRGSIAKIGKVTLINDSYNASPASMKSAFAKTAEVWEGRGKKGRRLAALGDMLELGETEIALHKALAAPLKEAGFDLVFTAGARMKHLHKALPPAMRGGHADVAGDLRAVLAKALQPGDILLVKGSHGSKMYELAEALMKDKKNAL